MFYVLGLIAAVVVVWAYFHFKGNPGFWAMTRKHPHEAMHLFHTDPAWIVHGGPKDALPGDVKEWVGPFHVLDPISKNLVKVYGKNGAMDASEAKFIATLSAQ